MNPFDWAGPQFLVFYVVFAAVLLGWLELVMRREDTPGDLQHFTDPYEIACLRDGPEEMVRVVTFALIGRGPLRIAEDEIVVRDDGPTVTHPLEVALVEAYRENPGDVDGNPTVANLANEYADRLVKQGARISNNHARRVQVVRATVLSLLLGVGVTKLISAVERGRTNVGLLILAMVISAVIGVHRRHLRTARGEDFLNHMKTMLSGSQVNTKEEMLMITAVWGAAGLAEFSRVALEKVFPAWKLTWFERWMNVRRSIWGNGTMGSCGHGGGDGGHGCGGCGHS